MPDLGGSTLFNPEELLWMENFLCFFYGSFESNPPLFCLCSQPNQVEVNSPFFTRKCIVMHFKDVDVSVNINVLVSSTNNSSPVSSVAESDAESVSQAVGDKMVIQSPKGGSEVDFAEVPITGGNLVFICYFNIV